MPHNRPDYPSLNSKPGCIKVVDTFRLMRVRASIGAGAAAPSTILRKLAAAGPNNTLSQALQALGRIERTLFTLQGIDPTFATLAAK